MCRIPNFFIVISHQSVPTTAQDQPIGRRGHHHLTTACGALPSRSHGAYHQRWAPIISLILPGKLAAGPPVRAHSRPDALRHVTLHRQALRDRTGFPKHHTVSQRFAGYSPFAKELRQAFKRTRSRIFPARLISRHNPVHFSSWPVAHVQSVVPRRVSACPTPFRFRRRT